MSIIVNNKFEIGDIVYLVTDRDQLPRIVFSFKVTASDILYEVAYGTTTSPHYDFELSKEPNTVLKTTN